MAAMLSGVNLQGVSSVKMLNSCELLLVELTSRAPGMIEGLYLTAKLWVLKGKLGRRRACKQLMVPVMCAVHVHKPPVVQK